MSWLLSSLFQWLLIALGLSRADFSYIFPITEAGWWNIIQASKETITAMYGFEIILIAFPKVNGSSVAKLKAILSPMDL